MQDRLKVVCNLIIPLQSSMGPTYTSRRARITVFKDPTTYTPRRARITVSKDPTAFTRIGRCLIRRVCWVVESANGQIKQWKHLNKTVPNTFY